ncbi:calcium-binding protein [Streptomyces sp. NPDC059649]|uniref:calcium-binding protein n=1 Tax=Streptomyces sp. NPDC059649 TaxID=3346895 RepID=UPI0036C3111B
MRIRATAAALSGALAISALAIPAAQAADVPGAGAATARLSPFVAQSPAVTGADETRGDTKITNVTVNGGKDIVVGTSLKKTYTVSVTATDPDGIYDGYAFLWHGTDLDSRTGVDGAMTPSAKHGSCKQVNATTATCSVTLVADPDSTIYGNRLAGRWHVYAAAVGKDGDLTVRNTYKSGWVKRASKLTTDAGPEPVKKGASLTVTGALSRANWDTDKYGAYGQQSVQLQFRKQGASSYSTVKTVTSDSRGNLRTTVKASADGYWRYVFAGTATSSVATSTSDYVDVK